MPRREGHTAQGHATARRGTLTVETALLAPLVIAFMFAIVETGALVADVAHLANGAREGVRRAAVGGMISDIEAAVHDGAAHLRPERLEVSAEFRTIAGAHVGQWQPLQDVADTNNAAPGSQVRVMLTYDHRFVAGSLYSRLVGRPGAVSTDIGLGRAMRRE